MPTVFVDQEWGRRIEGAKRGIFEKTGIREPTVSQALDFLIYQRAPKPISDPRIPPER